MRILFLSENFPPETNAASSRVYERACYWAAWGLDVTVVTCQPNFPRGRLHEGYGNPWYQVETMDGIHVVRVKTFIAPNTGTALRLLDFLSFLVTGTIAALRQPRPDVVSATSPQFFAAVAGWLVGMLRRRPFVFELGDIWPASIVAVGAMRPSLAMRLMERLELFLYRRSAAVLALTPAFKANLVGRGIEEGKIAVVINGVDLQRYAPRPRDATLAAEWELEDRFVVGYIGTHGMAHALGNVLDAAERLPDGSNVRFLLVGDGAERRALVTDRRSRAIGPVIMKPAEPKEAMPAVWSLCDVALVHLKNSPTFAEVIPSKIFEAMAMGLPILLAAPAGEASRIVVADGAGIHVPAEDADALARAALRLAQDDTLRAELAANALAAAPSHSRERQAADCLRVLERAAAGDCVA